jgi:hypothetical protein
MPDIATASACGSIVASSLKRSRSLMIFQSGARQRLFQLALNRL